MSTRGVRRFVEDLLRQRRPRRFAAEPDDEAELRTAIMLRDARPGSGVPSEEFVTGLRQRLATELDGETAPAQGGNRRRFVQITSAAAATAAVAGAGLDHILVTAGTSAGPAPDRTMVPDTGEWRAVVAASDLPEGGVRAFDLGAVAGFVRRAGGQVQGVSATCTHLGCRLALDAPQRRLNCPCHRTAFTVDGAVLFHQLPVEPPPLPHLMVRESGGVIEVFVPPVAT
ncbi:QcrA and Rieske domain-containing protein [Amycolatopsis pigmentata]|uniref:Ubiquinol-cytochrome c reductase iron-sulfur subunit n=1 Tax=Amycolatopsis pigmentata TaxID=450801 RepID=A0ABW5FQG2_9PSEU